MTAGRTIAGRPPLGQKHATMPAHPPAAVPRCPETPR
jgi:hypothetical protein